MCVSPIEILKDFMKRYFCHSRKRDWNHYLAIIFSVYGYMKSSKDTEVMFAKISERLVYLYS